ELGQLKVSARVRDGMAAIGADDKIRARVAFALRRLHADADDLLVLDEQIDNFVLHVQRKSRELFRVTGEEVEEIPLRHEGDKFALRGQVRKIRDRLAVAVHYTAQLEQFLMRQLDEFVQQRQVLHDHADYRMVGVAPEGAIQ